MFSARFFTFFLLLLSFGLLACATPVELSTSALTARTVAGLEHAASKQLVARCDTGSCTCTTAGCNEQAIKNILVNLKTTIDVSVKAINSATDPTEAVNDICAAIAVAVDLLAAVKVNVSTAGLLIVDIVNIIVAIVLALATCVTALGPTVAATVAAKLDVAIATLLTTVKGLIPGLVGLLYTALTVDITLLQSVKYVLTLVACNLPCGC